LIATNTYLQKIIAIVKPVLLVTTFVFIAYKLFVAYDIDVLFSEYQLQLTFSNLFLMVIVLGMMPFNILFELYKWKLLVGKYEQISIATSAKAVFSGICLSILTPNQIGSFAGRIIHLKELNKIKGTLIAVIGNTAQALIAAVMGLLAGIFFLWYFDVVTDLWMVTIIILWLLLIVVVVYFYFHINKISLIRKWPKLVEYLSVFGAYESKELRSILLFSLIRYLLFSTQYFLLLQFFGIDIGFVESYAAILATLFVQGFVPSFLLIELGMRGASAIWLIGIFSDNLPGILLSAYTLWIINLMIPALVGLFVLLKWRAV